MEIVVVGCNVVCSIGWYCCYNGVIGIFGNFIGIKGYGLSVIGVCGCCMCY